MKRFWWIVLLCLLLVGCSRGAGDSERDALMVYSPHPLEFIDPIVSEFETETGIAVQIISAGTGELLARIEAEDTPCGDVLWGGSLSTLESKKDLFEVYYSQNEAHAIYKNTDGHITRFTMMPSVIMVNTNLKGDLVIQGYADLLNPELKGKIAFADPSKSSSSYEQLLNQIWAMGEGDIEKGWEYVWDLTDNLNGQLLDSSSSVYNGVVQGEYIVGLTFEEAAAKFVASGAPVEIVYPVEGTIVRPDGVSIIKGAPNLKSAKQFVDFVTSLEIQHLMATELNRRSIRDDVVESNGLTSYDDIYIIEDNQVWSSDNKETILEQYKTLFKEINQPQED